MTMHLESIPDPFPAGGDEEDGEHRARAALPADAGRVGGSPREAEEILRARDAEHTLTTALTALKRKGQRAATTMRTAFEHKRAVQIVVAVGAVALLLYAVSGRRRRRRPPTLAGAVARSLLREAAARMVLGAAAAAGARLAEAAVPMLVASISARAEAHQRPSRRRRASLDD